VIREKINQLQSQIVGGEAQVKAYNVPFNPAAKPATA
jgi:hypothetical protein